MADLDYLASMPDSHPSDPHASLAHDWCTKRSQYELLVSKYGRTSSIATSLKVEMDNIRSRMIAYRDNLCPELSKLSAMSRGAIPASSDLKQISIAPTPKHNWKTGHYTGFEIEDRKIKERAQKAAKARHRLDVPAESDPRTEKVLALYDDGISIQNIATQSGMSPRKAAEILRVNGIDTSVRQTKPRAIIDPANDPRRDEFERLYASNSIEQIAKLTGVSQKRISACFHACGIQVRPIGVTISYAAVDMELLKDCRRIGLSVYAICKLMHHDHDRINKILRGYGYSDPFTFPFVKLKEMMVSGCDMNTLIVNTKTSVDELVWRIDRARQLGLLEAGLKVKHGVSSADVVAATLLIRCGVSNIGAAKALRCDKAVVAQIRGLYPAESDTVPFSKLVSHWSRGFSYAQIGKMTGLDETEVARRFELTERYGVKFN